ncbi:lipase [Siansivirga zeaxanthinifaciens CC-SAMT-1]|uniref:Lipase n=1 Tax=Siansivirga zeaxanthinifaciens CC-SAMT-1 TaxID=1454006 RepID=A0A0C5VZ61_9FLAO|nr:lipase [Siansivirga zeaxanthinifaciens CC-SAMT-1]
MVDVAPAPAAIQDVRCALIYLLKNANEFNIDTNKIVIMGGSSGGHLALMGGLLATEKHFDNNCEYEGEIKVAAIINKYGVSDLVPLKNWSSAKKWLGNYYLDVSFVKSVSPIYWVNKNSPPVFIIHGDEDPIVPYAQSIELYQKLVSFGVKTEFVTIPKGKHGKFSANENAMLSNKMWNFLNSLEL